MSCVSGIQLSDTSCSLKPAAWRAPSAFARMLRCVSTTPFGSLVEPEENWMNAVSPAVTRAGVPGARDVVELVDQERARARAPSTRCRLRRSSPRTPPAGRAACGRCRAAAAELPRDAQQLVLVLVADADRDRHRHDAAVQAGPERVDELLVARRRAGSACRPACAPMRCRWNRMPSARRLSSRQLQPLLRAFALEVHDRAVAAAAIVEHLRQRLVPDHRVTTLICRSSAMRRLMRASMSACAGCGSTSRKRRRAPFRCTSIS